MNAKAKEIYIANIYSACCTIMPAFFQGDLPKAVNEFLVFVAYVSRRFLSVNRDVRVGAAKLLYKQGHYFSEVHAALFYRH